jgi:hypothetical protein
MAVAVSVGPAEDPPARGETQQRAPATKAVQRTLPYSHTTEAGEADPQANRPAETHRWTTLPEGREPIQRRGAKT